MKRQQVVFFRHVEDPPSLSSHMPGLQFYLSLSPAV